MSLKPETVLILTVFFINLFMGSSPKHSVVKHRLQLDHSFQGEVGQIRKDVSIDFNQSKLELDQVYETLLK